MGTLISAVAQGDGAMHTQVLTPHREATSKMLGLSEPQCLHL